MYTAGTAFLEAPREVGISSVFANLGSDQWRHDLQLEARLAEAVAAVREEERAAVLDVWLPHL